MFHAQHFDDRYHEVARLRDGTEVLLRAVRPDDKPLLREGFERLSDEARYLRFHGVKNELSDAELRYLTETDGVSHLAIGAVRFGPAGEEEGLGIARLVRLTNEPTAAEAAITVLDSMQGKGLGTLLFQRLVAAAGERGIERVRCLVLGSNVAMQDLLKRISADSTVSIEAGVVTVEIPLPHVRHDAPQEEAPRDSGLYEMLRMAAKRVLSFRGSDA